MADTKITFEFDVKGKATNVTFLDPAIKNVGDLGKRLLWCASNSDKLDKALVKLGSKLTPEMRKVLSMAGRAIVDDKSSISRTTSKALESGKSDIRIKVPVREKGLGRAQENPFDMVATEKYRAKLKQRMDEGINGIINEFTKMLKGVATDIAKGRVNSVVKSVVKDTRINRRADQLFGRDPSTMKNRWNTFETGVATSKQTVGMKIGAMSPVNKYESDTIAKHRQAYDLAIANINSEVSLLSQRGKFTNRQYKLYLSMVRTEESLLMSKIRTDISNAQKIDKQAVTSGNKQVAMAEVTANKNAGYYDALRRITEGAKNKLSNQAISGKINHSQASSARSGVDANARDAFLQLSGILNNKSLNSGQVKLAVQNLFNAIKTDLTSLTAQVHADAKRAGMGANGLRQSPLNISKKSMFTEHSANITAEMTRQHINKVRLIKEEMEMERRAGRLTEESAKVFQGRIKALETTTAREINGAINMVRKLTIMGNKAEAIKVSALQKEIDNSAKYKQRLQNTINSELSMLHMRTAKYSNIGAPHRAGIQKGLEDKRKVFDVKIDAIRALELGEEKTKVAINQLFAELGHSIDRLKGDVSASGKVKMMHMLTSTANLRTVGGAVGAGALQMGSGLAQQVSSSHTKGQVAGAFRDLFTTAISSSWYMAVSELGNIFGQMGDIIVESVMQPLRLLGSLVAGALKGIGTLAISAFMVSFTTIASAFGGPWAMAITGSFALVTVAVYALMQVFSDLMDYIKNVLTSIKEIIFSVVKLALMTVVSVFKSFITVIKSALDGMVMSFKEMFKMAMEVTKNAFEGILKITKESVTEFAGLWEYAARSFKETIPNIGESAQAFARSMIGLKSAFGFKKEDVGEAYFDTVSSGFRSLAQAESMVTGASRLAIMSTSDLMTAQNALITVMQNYGPMGQTVEQTIQSLAAGATLGRFTMGELGTSLKSVIGIGSRTGMAFDDLMQSLSMMTKVFGRGSIEESTKYLGRFVEALAMPGRQGAKGLKELGIEFKGIGDKAPTFKDFIGLIAQMKNWSFENVRKVFTTIQSRRAWLALTQDVENYQKQIKESVEIKANLWRQEAEMMGTSLRQWAMLRESVNSVMILWGGSVWNVVGDAFKDVVAMAKQLIQVFQGDKMTAFFSELVKYMQPMVDTVIVPIRNAFGDLFNLINRGTGSGNAWGKIFGGTIAQGIQHIIINIFRAIKSIPAVLSEAYNIIMKIFPALGGMGSTLGDVFKNMWAYLTSTDYVSWIQKLVATVIGYIELIYGVLTDGSMWSELWNNIVSGLAIAMDAISGILGNFIPPIFAWITDLATASLDYIFSYLQIGLTKSIMDVLTNNAIGKGLALLTGFDLEGAKKEGAQFLMGKTSPEERFKYDMANANNKFKSGGSGQLYDKKAEAQFEMESDNNSYLLKQLNARLANEPNKKKRGLIQGDIGVIERNQKKIESDHADAVSAQNPYDKSVKDIEKMNNRFLTGLGKTGEGFMGVWNKHATRVNGPNSLANTVSKQIGDVLRSKDASLKGNEKHRGELKYDAQNEYGKAVTSDKEIMDQERLMQVQGASPFSGGNKRIEELRKQRAGIGGGLPTEKLKELADQEKEDNIQPELEDMTDEQLAKESAKLDKERPVLEEKTAMSERNLKTHFTAGEMMDKDMASYEKKNKGKGLTKKEIEKKRESLAVNGYGENSGVVSDDISRELTDRHKDNVTKQGQLNFRDKKVKDEIEFRREKKPTDKPVETTDAQTNVAELDKSRKESQTDIYNAEQDLVKLKEGKGKLNEKGGGAWAGFEEKIKAKEQQISKLKEKDAGIKSSQEKAQSEADQIATYKSLATNLENYFKNHTMIMTNTTAISTDLKGVMSGGGGVNISLATPAGTPSVAGAV